MWEEMQSDWENFAIESFEEMKLLDSGNEAEQDLESTLTTDETVDYTGSSRIVQTKARIGQNLFRKAVLSSYDFKCCITGLSVPDLLIASHIIPWREDVSNRLNPRNGLSLSVLHDKAFDIGIITINDNMTVRVSQKYFKNTDSFFASSLIEYEGKPISLPE